VHGEEPWVDAPNEQQEGGLGGLVRGRAPVVDETVLPAAVEVNPLLRGEKQKRYVASRSKTCPS